MRQDNLAVVGIENWHVYHILSNLRAQDQAELDAGGYASPASHIEWAISAGRAWAVISPTGEPVGMGGVAPSGNPKVGSAWFLGTDGLSEHWREFVRRSPAYISALHSLYPLLSNAVHSRNTVHIRWLRRVGFEFDKRAVSTTPTGEKFLTFVRRKK